MAEGGGVEPAPAEPKKRGMGWRLWAVIAIVIIVIGAGVAYYVTRPSGPTRDKTTITYYMQSEPISFDSADVYDLWSFVTLQNTYDTLVGYDRDTLNLVPDLASSWTATPDGLHYTFNLRTDVKFADGSNFTANDVYTSFKRILVWGAPTTGVDWILNQNLDKTNIPGAMWGGIILGVLESLAAGFIPNGSDWKDVIAFTVLLLILLFRPEGLFGRHIPEKL